MAVNLRSRHEKDDFRHKDQTWHISNNFSISHLKKQRKRSQSLLQQHFLRMRMLWMRLHLRLLPRTSQPMWSTPKSLRTRAGRVCALNKTQHLFSKLDRLHYTVFFLLLFFPFLKWTRRLLLVKHVSVNYVLYLIIWLNCVFGRKKKKQNSHIGE